MSSIQNAKRDLIVLIQQRTPERRTTYLPFGLLLIGKSLRQEGFRTYLIDLRFETINDLKTVAKDASVLFFGFSMMTGPIIKETINISKILKAIRPEIPIVVGGPHPTILPEQTLSNPLIDIVCIGEGENTSVEIAKSLQTQTSLEKICGIGFKKNNIPKLTNNRNNIYDFKNYASYDLSTIPIDRYTFLNKGKKSVHIITSRGCPFRCTFCWNVIYCKRKYRSWNVEKIKQEIQPLINSGVKRIIFWESFLGSKKRIIEIAQLMKQLNLSWAIEDGFHVKAHNSEKIFSALSMSNCDSVAFGAESGNQDILNFLKKDITIENITDAAKNTKKYNLGARFQWIMGLPTQNRNKAIETLDLINEINSINPLSAHTIEMFVPYPGSEIYDYVISSGWNPPTKLEDWSFFRSQMNNINKKDHWFYKTITYSNFYANYKKISNLVAGTKLDLLRKMIITLIGFISKWRWKKKFFYIPIEYILLDSLIKIYIKLKRSK